MNNKVKYYCILIFILFSGFNPATVQATPKPETDQGTQMREPVARNLPPCPKKPNCVNSMSYQDKRHYILPLSIHPEEGKSNMDILLEVINRFDRIKVAKIDGNYLRVEFKSRFFGFVDDVEFIVKESHTDVRSASRKGYYDMGVNRKRVEEIRKRLMKKANRAMQKQ